MGFRCVISGYILIQFGDEDKVKDAISSYAFDDIYPFRNCFSLIFERYKDSVISFADSHKMIREDCNDWLKKFEELLYKLNFNYAKVSFENEEEKDIMAFGYTKYEGNFEKYKLNIIEEEIECREFPWE